MNLHIHSSPRHASLVTPDAAHVPVYYRAIKGVSELLRRPAAWQPLAESHRVSKIPKERQTGGSSLAERPSLN